MKFQRCHVQKYFSVFESGFCRLIHCLFFWLVQTWDPEEASVSGRRASLSDLSCLDDIEALSVRQLKEILARNFVNYTGCCEKWELMERVRRLYQEQQNLLGEYQHQTGSVPGAAELTGSACEETVSWWFGLIHNSVLNWKVELWAHRKFQPAKSSSFKQVNKVFFIYFNICGGIMEQIFIGSEDNFRWIRQKK